MLSLGTYLQPLVIMTTFVALDVLTGFTAAVTTRSLSSSVMRAGLLHKAAYYLVFMLAVSLQVGSQYMELGVTIPAVNAVVIYIVSTEIVSITENAGIINPDLKNTAFMSLFGKLQAAAASTDTASTSMPATAASASTSTTSTDMVPDGSGATVSDTSDTASTETDTVISIPVIDTAAGVTPTVAAATETSGKTSTSTLHAGGL